MKKTITIICLIWLAASPLLAQQIRPFEEGERAVFLGNSITDAGHYHSYIWLYYMTRFPDRKINIFNAGIGGDVAQEMYLRLQDDVFSHDPTYLALTFGMNDTGYGIFNEDNAKAKAKENIESSRTAYSKIEEELKKHPDVYKVIIASSPYDQTTKGKTNYFPHKNDALLKIADFQEASAKENNWGFIDLNHPMTVINLEGQKTDSLFSICGRDRIHPGNDGHLVMASLFLQAQGFKNVPVSNTIINVSEQAVQKAENCTINKLEANKDKVSFEYIAEALPFPIDTVPRGWEETKSASDALAVIPFMKEYDQELLTVQGLDPDKEYELQIDEQPLGTWKGSDWEKGINLAENRNTPQYQQAIAIMELNEERYDLDRRFRMYYWLQFKLFRDKGMLFADNLAAVDTLNKYAAKDFFVAMNKDNYMKARFKSIRENWQDRIDAIIEKIYEINQPVPHQITIIPVSNT